MFGPNVLLIEGRVKVLCEEKRYVESSDSSTSTSPRVAIARGQVLYYYVVSSRTKRWTILLADDTLQPDALGMVKRSKEVKVRKLKSFSVDINQSSES